MDIQIGGYARERLVKQQRAGDDRVAGEMPCPAWVVGRKPELQFSHSICPLPHCSRSFSRLARVSFPVELRGKASTRCNGLGKKTASMRWRNALKISPLVRSAATTKAVNRDVSPAFSSCMKKTPS